MADNVVIDEGTGKAIAADGIVTVRLSGGTAGELYSVACKITTNQGRTDERTMRIRVLER